MSDGFKSNKHTKSLKAVHRLGELASCLAALRADLSDDITLEDVKRNPDLGRVLVECDGLSNRLRYEALEWLKGA